MTRGQHVRKWGNVGTPKEGEVFMQRTRVVVVARVELVLDLDTSVRRVSSVILDEREGGAHLVEKSHLRCGGGSALYNNPTREQGRLTMCCSE